MSQKIDDVLAVLATVRKQYSAYKPRSLSAARIRAVREIARAAPGRVPDNWRCISTPAKTGYQRYDII
jgi:hypothetical protein